jgi:hypothetical protein
LKSPNNFFFSFFKSVRGHSGEESGEENRCMQQVTKKFISHQVD